MSDGFVAFLIILFIALSMLESNNLKKRLSDIEKELAVVKTVLIMQKIMPQEVCKIEKEKAD